MTHGANLSIVLPAKNEAAGLTTLLPELVRRYPEAEIIVVDDGSTDDTLTICTENQVQWVSHPYSMGNGAAIKAGARHASREYILFMDADGQHDPSDIPSLLEKLQLGYEMVVGARNPETHASTPRRLANYFFNKMASLMTGYQIDDLTSGFRLVRAKSFRRFLYLLPNGFSYPTTSTMAFFRSGLPVAYVPIDARERIGKSHIRAARDGFRFAIIILKIGALFSPMRLFLPVSMGLMLTGTFYYLYTYLMYNRFTNMSVLLLIASVFIFLIGIVSEQVSSLHYKDNEDR